MRSSRRGAGLLESTLALASMMFVMMGTVEAGRYLFASQMLPHLAREGARWALVHPEGDVRAFVLGSVAGLPAREVTVRVERRAADVLVETEWIYRAALPLPAVPVRGRAVVPLRR